MSQLRSNSSNLYCLYCNHVVTWFFWRRLYCSCYKYTYLINLPGNVTGMMTSRSVNYSVLIVTSRLQVRLPPGPLLDNDLGKAVHTHVLLFTKQYNLVLIKGRWRSAAGKWEGNRRSGVALAMRHGLSGLSTYGLTAAEKKRSTPHIRPSRGMAPLPYLSVDYCRWSMIWCLRLAVSTASRLSSTSSATTRRLTNGKHIARWVKIENQCHTLITVRGSDDSVVFSWVFFVCLWIR